LVRATYGGEHRGREAGVVEESVVQRALSECWAAEVSGVAYYETLAGRFPEHRRDFDVLAVVEKTTRDLIESVARKYDVSIDHSAADRVGVEVAQMGEDWRSVLETALSYTPETLRMYANLASVLPDEETALGHAVVEHERAQIVLYESVVTDRPDDWSAIEGFLERHGARHRS
jgi:rubrerythrin